MRSTTLDPRAATPRSDDEVRRALDAHVRTALRGPLAALRAALEAERGRMHSADRALDELERIERAALDLVTWSTPASPRHVACTLGEVADGLRARLMPDERARLWVSVEDSDAPLVTDGPRLVEALARLARAGLADAARETLFHAHADADRATFSLVDDPGVATEVADAAAADLPQLLAERELARLGGSCTVHPSSERHRCIVLRVPRGEASA